MQITLCNTKENIVSITPDTFYLKFLYRSSTITTPHSVGTAIANVFITPRGIGSGLLYLSFDDQKDAIYIACLCSYTEAMLSFVGGAIIGGHGIYENFSGGSVTFVNKKTGVMLKLHALSKDIFQGQTLFQNYIMTNKKVYTTYIQAGNPNTIFRVGSYDVQNLNENVPIARLYFAAYDENTTRGIGSQLFINDNQLFFIYYLAGYTSIIDPSTVLKSIRGCIAGGQKTAQYIQTGIFSFHTFPSPIEKFTYFYKEKDQFDFFQHDRVIAANRETTVIPTKDVFGTIRFGYFELYTSTDDSDLVGYLYFSTFITDKRLGFGQGVFAFNTGDQLFYSFQNNPENPLDPASRTITTGCLTGRTGQYSSITWGTTDWTTTSDTSYEIVITYPN
jgi:hypothetical protein